MIKKELKIIQATKNPFIRFFELNGDDITQWFVYIKGPPGTLYEGGLFKTLIRFPSDFPMEPPSIQFLPGSCIYHPNIYRDGKVCLSTLQKPIPDHLLADDPTYSAAKQDKTVFWNCVLGVEAIYTTLICLLSEPNPNDPANAEAAQVFLSDPASFRRKVHAVVDESIRKRPAGFSFDVDVLADNARAKLFRQESSQSSQSDYDPFQNTDSSDECPSSDECAETSDQCDDLGDEDTTLIADDQHSPHPSLTGERKTSP